MTPKWGTDGYPEPKDVAAAFEWIAFTEHVKCAPRGGKSKPTVAMWERCGAHILREELLLLEPEHILVLGQSRSLAKAHAQKAVRFQEEKGLTAGVYHEKRRPASTCMGARQESLSVLRQKK